MFYAMNFYFIALLITYFFHRYEYLSLLQVKFCDVCVCASKNVLANRQLYLLSQLETDCGGERPPSPTVDRIISFGTDVAA